MDEQNPADRPRPPGPCPICGRPARPERRPFCSKRCADIDLGRWLKGVYAVPTEEAPEEAGEGAGEGRRDTPI